MGGKKVGKWKKYDKNGRLISTSIFDIDPTEDEQKKQKRTNIMKDENDNLKLNEEKICKIYLHFKYKYK